MSPCTSEHCTPCIGRAPFHSRAQQWPCRCAFAAMKDSTMPADDCPAPLRAAAHLARLTVNARDTLGEWEVILTRLAMEQSRLVARDRDAAAQATVAESGRRA